MEKELNGKMLVIPEHVTIILDGNGRWAKAHHMPRNMGHSAGAKTVEDILEVADDIGIKYLTVYAFSTENWKRPDKEVNALMKLLERYLKTSVAKTTKNNMKVRVIGEKSRLNEKIRQEIANLEEVSRNNTGLNFTIALNYGSRDEIVRAVRRLSDDVRGGTVHPEEISEDMLNSYLDTCELPDPDLMIRTSGEQRLSNWMMWQHAYAEFYFTEVPWPDFNRDELIKAIEFYNTRDRRFGAV